MRDETTHPGDLLVDYHYGELAPEARSSVDAHLAGCATCRADLAVLERLGGMVDGLESPLLDDERVLDMVAEIARRRPFRERAWAALRGALGPVEAIFLPGFLGALLCVLTLAPIAATGGFERVPPLILLLCGIVWTSIYNSVVTTLLRGEDGPAALVRLRVVLYAVLAALAGTHLLAGSTVRLHNWFAYLPSRIFPIVAGRLALRPHDSITAAGCVALFCVLLALGFFVRRRLAGTSVLVVALYLFIALPGALIVTRAPLTLAVICSLAAPLVLFGVGGALIGHLLGEIGRDARRIRLGRRVSDNR